MFFRNNQISLRERHICIDLAILVYNAYVINKLRFAIFKNLERGR